MRWYKVLIPVFLLLSIGTLYSFQYEAPDPTWETFSLANNTSGQFVQAAATEGQVHVLYMSTEDGGVTYHRSQSEDSLMSAINRYRSGRSWDSGTVENETNSGRYLSVAASQDSLYAIYQDSTVGTESVTVANFSAGNWDTEQIASSGADGINVGMYSTIASSGGRTIAGYHAPAYGLTGAIRKDEWDKTELGDNAGWFTASDTCDERSVMAYAGRESSQLRVSVLDDSWNTENTTENAESGIGVAMDGCDYRIFYMDPDSNSLKTMKDGKIDIIDRTGPSRLGSVYKDGYYVSYHKTGGGVHLARSQNGVNWSSQPVDITPETGGYNDVAVDSSGNVFVVYEEEEEILVSELNEGTVGGISSVLGVVRGILLALTIAAALLLVFSIYRNREYLEKTFHIGGPK